MKLFLTKKRALKSSIQHWEELVDTNPSVANLGIDHCALCVKYYTSNCIGCPVFEKTGKIHCNDSPYRDAIEAKQGYIRTVDQEYANDFKLAAQKELEFLKSLL